MINFITGARAMFSSPFFDFLILLCLAAIIVASIMERRPK